MGKLRVLLDEDVDVQAKSAFARKVMVYTVGGLGLKGKEDRIIVEEAVERKCVIVTANKDFVPEYKNHEWRKGKDGRYFWGLIFLKHSKAMSQSDRITLAIKQIVPLYDDVLTVSGTGLVTRERLGGPAVSKRSPDGRHPCGEVSPAGSR